jgi:hypothetical protein
MDDDLSKENRIRLIGRLFLNYIAAMLKEVEIERGSFVNFSQNVIRKSNFLGIIWGQLGQRLGQINQESSSDSW